MCVSYSASRQAGLVSTKQCELNQGLNCQSLELNMQLQWGLPGRWVPPRHLRPFHPKAVRPRTQGEGSPLCHRPTRSAAGFLLQEPVTDSVGSIIYSFHPQALEQVVCTRWGGAARGSPERLSRQPTVELDVD